MIFGRRNKPDVDDNRLVVALNRLTCVLERLVSLLVPGPATGFTISQVSASMPTAIGASQMGVINGVQAGASGVFVATPTPVGGALQPNAVPTWATDHPDVTSLTVSPDGLTCTAAVAASGTGSFVLTITGVASDGTKISGSATVPILPAAVVPATGFDISQSS